MLSICPYTQVLSISTGAINDYPVAKEESSIWLTSIDKISRDPFY